MNTQENKQKCIVVLGPTSSGKSNLAVELAKAYNGEIISADSRQVYQYMDIGTGKVTKEEMGGVPHHLLDVTHPTEQFSVVDFERLATKAAQDIAARGKLPIICGGTGYYIDAFLYGVDAPGSTDPELHEELEKRSAEDLFAELEQKDSRRAAAIDPHNKRRLVRALEIIATTGQPVPERQPENRYDTLKLGIKWPREKLNERIEKRLITRLENGILCEVQRLHEHENVTWERMEAFGLEYRWSAYLFTGKLPDHCGENCEASITPSDIPCAEQFTDETLSAYFCCLNAKIRQYAKRQMTWFKRDEEIHWVSAPQKALSITETWLHI